MNTYEIWVDPAPGVHDLELIEAARAYLELFIARGMMEGYRIRRRKFGFSPPGFGEFNFSLDFRDLAQLDKAFEWAATRGKDIEPLHAALYSRVTNFKSALYRDFPDPVREAGS